jgi:hypothetical protein
LKGGGTDGKESCKEEESGQEARKEEEIAVGLFQRSHLSATAMR